jgi:HD-like signal output (HDOD) protein
VSSVKGAVLLLGVETVRAIALSMEVCEEAALTTRRPPFPATVQARDVEASADGVLPDGGLALGKRVLLDRFGRDYSELLGDADADPTLDLAGLELERFGVSHAAVGMRLAGLWGLSRG